MTKSTQKSTCCNAGTYKKLEFHLNHPKVIYICKTCGGICETK